MISQAPSSTPKRRPGRPKGSTGPRSDLDRIRALLVREITDRLKRGEPCISPSTGEPIRDPATGEFVRKPCSAAFLTAGMKFLGKHGEKSGSAPFDMLAAAAAHLSSQGVGMTDDVELADIGAVLTRGQRP